MGLDIDALIANSDSKVIITMPAKGISVSGFVTEELSGSGQANYSDLFETSSQESLSKSLTQLGVLASAGAAKFFDKQISFSQVQLVTREQTVAMYTGSSKPTFTIPLIFVALKPEPKQNPAIRVKRLLSAVYPGLRDVGAGVKFLSAPMNYKPAFKGNTATGTVSLAIGKWFLAMNMLITGVSYSFSKELTSLGFPLYGKVSVTFESYRVMTDKEVSGFFIDTQDTGVGIKSLP